MSCSCPVQVLSDADNMPVPALYSVLKSGGACLDENGDYFYAPIRKTSGGTVYKMARWPFPALDVYEELIDSPNIYIDYPLVIGTDLLWIDSPTGLYRVVKRPVSGGATTVLYSFTIPANGGGIWGLRYSSSYAWIGYYAYDTGSPTSMQRTGAVRIDPETGTSTEFEYSDAPDDGDNQHLLGFSECAISDDGAIWHYPYGVGSGNVSGFARLDPQTGIWTTTTDSVNAARFPLPYQDGKVRLWDGLTNTAKLVDANMVVTNDPCAGGTPAQDLQVGSMSAWNVDQSIIVYKRNIDDKVVGVACSSAEIPVDGGQPSWNVGASR